MAEQNDAARPLLPLSRPIVGRAELAQLAEVLESGWLTRGPKTSAFEELFRAYIGSTAAVGLNSATSGLHLALVTLGIGAGDEVITTPITYCATANEIEHAGATPIFADVDPETYLIDPAAVERAITPRTRAIMPVHLYGQSADMDRLQAIAAKYGLAIIEDAAHALETSWREQKIGTIGTFTVFSFYPTKSMTTGEGGMLTTMDAALAERALRLTLHGLSRDVWQRQRSGGRQSYRLLERGYKYHMFDLLAALGLAQLPQVEARWAIRRTLFARYNERLLDVPGVRPIPVRMPGRHAYHLYVVEVDPARAGRTRDELADDLVERGIATGIHFSGLHLEPYFAARYGLRPEAFPNATLASERMLSVPLYAGMAEADVDRVVLAIKDATQVAVHPRQ